MDSSEWVLLAEWGEADAVHAALRDEGTGEIAIASRVSPDHRFFAIGQVRPGAIRLERTIRDLWGLAPEGLEVGATILASNQATTNDFLVGNNFPLEIIPPSTRVHAVELTPGRGAQIARSAGASLELVAVENGQAQLKMPSGELRMVNAKCRATIGVVGNGDQVNRSLGKAGRKRWMGRRPVVRGVAMNPVDHPNGGGQGKSKGGGGRQQIVSPWGQLAKGFPTRKRTQISSNFILIRKNGRPPRNKK